MSGEVRDIKERTYKFSLDVIEFISKMDSSLVNKIVSSQLLRSTTSIGANIVEAKSSSSRREFAKYYAIALKSANESIYWLSLIGDAKLISKESVMKLLNECDQIARIIAASLIKLKDKDRL